MSETWIGKHPRDGHEYDCQCARCGSSMVFVECDNCGGDGTVESDDWQDGDDEVYRCDWCNGAGGHWVCLASKDWCHANPREGRAHIGHYTPEWFMVRRHATS
jgi:hypothetical protein